MNKLRRLPPLRMISSPVRDAEPGDVWLFSKTDVVSRLIRMKTWSRFMHAELVFVNRPKGSGVELFTSKLERGVDFYSPDTRGLALVLRSRRKFDQAAATPWAERVVGQPFDVLGMASFWFAELQGRDNGRMFCSEAVTRCLRHGGFDLFPGADCDSIAPSYFAHSPRLSVIWRSADEWHRWQAAERQEVA